MTADQIIREIEALPPGEQETVVSFANRLAAERRLGGDHLSALAAQLAAERDPTKAVLLREAITRGFYGGKPDV